LVNDISMRGWAQYLSLPLLRKPVLNDKIVVPAFYF
jgi:hypothetical protein